MCREMSPHVSRQIQLRESTHSGGELERKLVIFLSMGASTPGDWGAFNCLFGTIPSLFPSQQWKSNRAEFFTLTRATGRQKAISFYKISFVFHPPNDWMSSGISRTLVVARESDGHQTASLTLCFNQNWRRLLAERWNVFITRTSPVDHLLYLVVL